MTEHQLDSQCLTLRPTLTHSASKLHSIASTFNKVKQSGVPPQPLHNLPTCSHSFCTSRSRRVRVSSSMQPLRQVRSPSSLPGGGTHWGN